MEETIAGDTSSAPAIVNPALVARQAVGEATAKVEAEIQAYKDAGLMVLGKNEDLQAIDLLQFWQVSFRGCNLIFIELTCLSEGT